MAFEKLRTIVITATLSRDPQDCRNHPNFPKHALRKVLRMAFRADHFAPLIREIFHVIDDEHFMFATGAREAGRPAETSASIRMTVKVKRFNP